MHVFAVECSIDEGKATSRVFTDGSNHPPQQGGPRPITIRETQL